MFLNTGPGEGALAERRDPGLAAGTLPPEVALAAAGTPGVGRVGAEVAFDAPWNPDMMGGMARVCLDML